MAAAGSPDRFSVRAIWLSAVQFLSCSLFHSYPGAENAELAQLLDRQLSNLEPAVAHCTLGRRAPVRSVSLRRGSRRQLAGDPGGRGRCWLVEARPASLVGCAALAVGTE